MQRYILSKSIDGNKTNDLKNLEGVSKVAQEFILALYDSHWDSLIVDDTNRLFRNNVKSKFSPQIVKEPTNPKSKNAENTSYVSSLPSPILAKTAKDINEILKYFKKNPSNNQKKPYAQVSVNSTNFPNIAKEILKIKKTLPSL